MLDFTCILLREKNNIYDAINFLFYKTRVQINEVVKDSEKWSDFKYILKVEQTGFIKIYTPKYKDFLQNSNRGCLWMKGLNMMLPFFFF